MVDKKIFYNPDIAIHPGETLSEVLEFNNISQKELAQRTGITEKHISNIVNGHASITPEMALKFERVFNNSASFWNNLQNNYDLVVARLEAEENFAKEIEEAKNFSCYTELAQFGFVSQTTNWKEKAENLLKFLGIDSFGYIHQTEPIAFRQSAGKFNEYSLAAWLRCGEMQAQKMSVEKFDRHKVKNVLSELRELTLPVDSFGEKLQALCASAGIALVFTPYFKNTKVNGSTRWMGDKAVIQLNTRGAYSDIFWFTFFHEIGHILMHGTKAEFLEYDGKTKDQKEKEADNFASEVLIPDKDYKELLSNKKLTRSDIKEFASRIGVDESIVFGRLAHDGRASWKKVGRLRKRVEIRWASE